jgi:hypothetical protein
MRLNLEDIYIHTLSFLAFFSDFGASASLLPSAAAAASPLLATAAAGGASSLSLSAASSSLSSASDSALRFLSCSCRSTSHSKQQTTTKICM